MVKSKIIFNENDRLLWLENEFEMYRGMLSDIELVEPRRLPEFTLVDVKKMPKRNCNEKELNRERNALAKNKQFTNIIKLESFHEDIEEDGYFYFAFEPSIITMKHLIQPDKQSELLANQYIPLIDIRTIMVNVTSGLMNLHKEDYFHRNIRPENILITKQDNCFVGKISNMMLSKRLRQGCWQSVTEGTFYEKVSNIYKKDNV